MSDEKANVGQIRTETHGHVFKIIIDNAAKKNAFTPLMMVQLSEALSMLHNTAELRAGVICAKGSDFTAGLDMPKFFGPKAEKWDVKDGNVDPLGLVKRCRKPIVTAVQGIVFTVGIELMLAGDIVVAAEDCRVQPNGIQARDRSVGWRALPFSDPDRVGRCDVSLIFVR